MNQPLDNFFRDKLANAHKPAPPAAWQKIDAGLAGRPRKGLWLKVAAAVLIVAAGTFVLWPAEQQNHDTPPLLAQQKGGSQQPVLQPAARPAAPRTAISTIPATPKKKTPVAPQRPAKLQPAPAPSAVYEHEYIANNDKGGVEPPVQPLPDLSVTPEPVQPTAVAMLAAAAPEENEQSVTLVYSADEVDEKYLDKDALAKATSAHKRSSTFRKLLAKAYDLKNNQDPFGGLRQKKNEILALSFKSEKRSQNK